MLARVHSAAAFGIDAHVLDVEVDVSGGLPSFTIVGLPDAAVRVLGPRFGLTPDYIAKHLGISFAVDNHRSVDELGLAYRPVRETMLDHYESWRARRAVPRSPGKQWDGPRAPRTRSE